VRWRLCRPLSWSAVAVAAVVPVAGGCSADTNKPAPTSVTVSRAPGTREAAATAPASAVALSPAGVTTKINVPAQSTEEEYFQACHAAKAWMQGHPGDHQALIEAYLAAVQAPGVSSAGTWSTPWAALPLARQAGVIVAAIAAADDECG
jgi:Putative lipoprotein LpqV